MASQTGNNPTPQICGCGSSFFIPLTQLSHTHQVPPQGDTDTYQCAFCQDVHRWIQGQWTQVNHSFVIRRAT